MTISLDNLLGIKYPVIQGGMAHIADGVFASNCSNEGILGTIASGSYTHKELEEQIHICRERTSQPFAVNVILNHPELDDICRVVINNKVSVVILGNGNAVKVISKFKECGIKVLPIIGSPEFARFYQREGADGIIAEGCESGGHIGPMTTMTLVPQVCDSVGIPVIAAGGIADRRQFNAAKALGACGVQIGTVLLSSVECPVHPNYKEALVRARSSSSVVTGRALNDEVRALRNELTNKYFELERNNDLDSIGKLLKGTYADAVVNGNVDNGTVMAGQVCGQIRGIRRLKEIIESICIGD